MVASFSFNLDFKGKCELQHPISPEKFGVYSGSTLSLSDETTSQSKLVVIRPCC